MGIRVSYNIERVDNKSKHYKILEKYKDHDDGQNLPGPGTYTPKNITGEQVPRLTIRERYPDFREPKKDNIPAPGAYTPTMPN